MAIETTLAGWVTLIHGNSRLFLVLLALAALDTGYGTLRAILQRRFQSTAFRQGIEKVVTEIALPMVVALLAVASNTFAPVVPVALWAGIVAEGTSLVEQLGGKKNGQAAAMVLKMLEGIIPMVWRGGSGEQSSSKKE